MGYGMPRSRTTTIADLKERVQPLHLFQTAFAHYLDLPCFFIRADEPRDWRSLLSTRVHRVWPLDFEPVRLWKDRVAYNDRMVRRAAATGEAQCAAFNGVHGLFVPVRRGQTCLGVLQTGVFLRKLPTEAVLTELWRAVSGRAPGSGDGEFLEFARAFAATPVLDGDLVEALAGFMGAFGAYLAGDCPAAETSERMSGILRGTFARRLWHRGWLEWQVLHRTFFRFSGEAKVLLPWEREEIGIEHFPDTVMVARREGTGAEWTDVLAAAEFAEAARGIVREFGDTLAYPHGGEGVLLLTHVGPGPDGRQELERFANQFVDKMKRRFGCRIWIGAGRPDSDGTRLAESYREAIAAVQVAVARDRPLVHYGELEPVALGETGLRRQSEALVRAAVERGRSGCEPLLGAFIQAVFTQTRGRTEACRRTFAGALGRLFSTLESGSGHGAAEVGDLEERVHRRLDEAVDLHGMEERFREGFAAVVAALEAPAQGDQQQRISRACAAVAAAPQQPWSLPALAKQFGFSASVFSRAFTKHQGMAFSEFLLQRRLELASRMLREGRPLRSVAQASGFSSVSYFCQAFKRERGVSPGTITKSVKHQT